MTHTVERIPNLIRYVLKTRHEFYHNKDGVRKTGFEIPLLQWCFTTKPANLAGKNLPSSSVAQTSSRSSANPENARSPRHRSSMRPTTQNSPPSTTNDPSTSAGPCPLPVSCDSPPPKRHWEIRLIRMRDNTPHHPWPQKIRPHSFSVENDASYWGCIYPWPGCGRFRWSLGPGGRPVAHAPRSTWPDSTGLSSYLNHPESKLLLEMLSMINFLVTIHFLMYNFREKRRKDCEVDSKKASDFWDLELELFLFFCVIQHSEL